MAKTLTYSFSDLPLIIDGPFEDNGVEGEAEVSYFPDGEWSILSVSIEVSRRKSPDEMEATGITSNRTYKQHVLDAGSPLDLIIRDRIENGKYLRRNLEDEVRNAIADDHAALLDNLADYKRDQMMERA